MTTEVRHPLEASVYWRENTREWVLEIKGSINDTYFVCRHTAPANMKPEDVPGLLHLYKESEKEYEKGYNDGYRAGFNDGSQL